MPVFYSPVPENLHMGLAYVGGSVFTNNRTADRDFTREQEDASVVNELVSHLPLQMLLYFNMFYFPCWWFSAVFMLDVKFYHLEDYYQGLLITGIVLLTLIEVVRLYLGFIGNLKEKVTRAHFWSCVMHFFNGHSFCILKVPELAAFWLLTFALQLPVVLFFLTDEDTIILPLERAVHSLYLVFLLTQIFASFLALRTMTRKLILLFHLRQFGKVENAHHVGMSSVYGFQYHRGVLPVSPVHHVGYQL